MMFLLIFIFIMNVSSLKLEYKCILIGGVRLIKAGSIGLQCEFNTSQY